MGGSRHFIILLLSCPVFAESASMDLHYEKGLEAYRNNQYDMAIQEFEIILNNNWVSSELYYNLGNAFYRNGNTAGAVWAYESCLKLSPSDLDADYNLKLANLKVKDRVDFPDPPIYLKWYMSSKENFTPTIWINMTLFILLLYSLTTTISRILAFAYLHYIQGIFISLFFISSFFTLHSIWTENSVKQGVINYPAVEARSEPNTLSARLFEVHEGLKVSVNETSEDWVEIELLDGKAGWIKNHQVLLIQ